jgi:hypothetical protein
MILFSQPFTLERDMLEPLLAALPSVGSGLVSAGTRIVREPTIGRVIPDVLLAEAFSGYAHLARARLTFIHCHALSMAHDPIGVSVERMRSELYVPQSVAVRVIDDLVRREFVVSEQGAFFAAETVALDTARMVAIEVKMRRWRQALAQARTYLAFADQSHVVLDGNQVSVDAEMDGAFRDAKIGLLLQYGSITVEEIPAPIMPVMSPERVWAFTKVARAAQR